MVSGEAVSTGGIFACRQLFSKAWSILSTDVWKAGEVGTFLADGAGSELGEDGLMLVRSQINQDRAKVSKPTMKRLMALMRALEVGGGSCWGDGGGESGEVMVNGYGQGRKVGSVMNDEGD